MAVIGFDPKKNAINIAKHGISLERAAEIKPMLVKYDLRFDYGEERMLLYGYIDGEPHCLEICRAEYRARLDWVNGRARTSVASAAVANISAIAG